MPATSRSAAGARPEIPSGTWTALTLGLAGVAFLAAAMAVRTSLGPIFVSAALATYSVVAAVVLRTIADTHPAPWFGLPNAVTLGRVIGAALLVGYSVDVAAGMHPPDTLAVAFAVLAAVAVIADGVDGWLARSRGPATPFGARFDMEIDALMLFALSALAFGLGKAGSWVMLIGGLRYLFVAAGVVWPWLAEPLPPSFRRKAVCVVQGVALILLALPAVGGGAATALAVAALAALAWSFAVDVGWLWRRAGDTAPSRG